MKKKQQHTQNGMSDVAGNVPQPVRGKGGVRLKTKRRRRLFKVFAAAAACAVLVGGVFAVNALYFDKAKPNVVDEGFVTVSYALPTDGSTPDMHSALENIGYMNARFRAQPTYYSEMAGVVDTMLTQQVNTWKQYDDGILVQTDITRSSMVNSARQFCYIGDRVIWRDAAGGASTYNGLETEWKTGAPAGNMTVEDFKATRGLPGTEFSVYVINEETLLSADPVVVNEDGTYTQTYYLDPATDKAPAYYVNQMMTTGGLTGLPSFESITVTYTFDRTWQVLSSDIDESYTATMGISVGCRAMYHTVYEYGTDRAQSSVYEDYFSEYASKPATGAEEETVTPAGCLSAAFAPVLQGPVTFRLGLTLNGKPAEGLVFVDASDMAALTLRAQIGELFLAYEGDVYLRLGDGFRGRLQPAQLAALFSSLTAAGTGEGLDTDDLLAQLGGGDFSVAADGRSASLSSVLSLAGMEVPVRFTFNVDGNGTVTLGEVCAQLSLAGVDVSASLSYTQEPVPETGDPASYLDMTGMVVKLADIVSGKAVGAALSYDLPTPYGTIAMRGEMAFDLATLSVRGELALAYGGAEKTLAFAYRGEGVPVVYLSLDGVNVRADVQSAADVVKELIGDAFALPELSVDTDALLAKLLSVDLASMISSSEEGVTLAAGRLLSALGISLDVGDVTLSETASGVRVQALGASVSLAPAQSFTLDENDYADYTDVVPWLSALTQLLSSQALRAEVSYETEEVVVGGELLLDVASLAVTGEVSLSYAGAEKTVSFAYLPEGGVYVAVDGIKGRVPRAALSDLLSELLPAGGGDAKDLLARLFALDLSQAVRLTEDGVTLDGDALLSLFGLDVSLGELTIGRTEDGVVAEALGASVALSPAQPFAADEGDYADYADLTPWLDALLALAGTDDLYAEIAYGQEGDAFRLHAYVFVDLESGYVAGNATVAAGSLVKGLSYYLLDGVAYLKLDEMRIRLSVAEAASLLADVFGGAAGAETEEIFKQLLAADLSELIALREEGAVLSGTRLLQLLGIDFAAGDIVLTPEEGGIRVDAMGASVRIRPCLSFALRDDFTEYTDVTPFVGFLAETVGAGALGFSGSVDFVYNGTAVAVAVEEGRLSWKNGLALYAELTVTAAGSVIPVTIDVTEARIRAAFGALGVELVYEELPALAEAFSEVYARIADLVNRSAAAGTFLPAELEELADRLGAGAAVADLLGIFDLSSFDLSSLVFGAASQREGSVTQLGIGAIVLDVCLGGRGAALFAEGEAGGVGFAGEVSLSAAGAAAEDTRSYLTVRDLCELLDFVGAAAGTLASPDVSVSFRDGVTVNTADGSTKFTINGSAVYHSGRAEAGFPVVVDPDKKVVTVHPEAYFYLALQLDEVREGGTDLNFAFWMLDGNRDGELEFYVSLSKFLPGEGESDPLCFSVSASDVLTILSGGLSLFGQEDGLLAQLLAGAGIPEETAAALLALLDEYLTDTWLTEQEQGQFAAVGEMLRATFGLDRMIEEMFGSVSDAVGGVVDGVQEGLGVDVSEYLASLGMSYGADGEAIFTISLNSDLIFGGEGKEPLTVTLKKADFEGGSLLTAVALGNLYGEGDVTSIGFAFDHAPLTLTNDGASATVAQNGAPLASLVFSDYADYTFAGVDDLLKSVALSATHKTQDGYALNESFYISGKATLSALIFNFDVQIHGLSVSFDADGNIVLNAMIEIPAIVFVTNGRTMLEMTARNGMIYFERTQYDRWNIFSFKDYDTPVVTYRVMPLSVFFADALGQLGFLLNLTDTIASQIKPGTNETETTVDDYGAVLSKYLKQYSYAARETGADWDLTINGGLTDGVLSDIAVTLGSETYNGTDNVLRKLSVGASLMSFLTMQADLFFRNPMDVWEEGYSDETRDISALFDGADLDCGDGYLTPVPGNVSYIADGVQVGSQSIWYDAGGALLTPLVYPEGCEKEGYALSWSEIGTDGSVYAVYTPKLYDVTFLSPVPLGEDWTKAEGGYTLTVQMEYGATVAVAFGDARREFTVGTQDNIVDLAAAVGDAPVLWEGASAEILASGASVAVPLMPDTVIYTSTVAFTAVGGAESIDEYTAQAQFEAAYTLMTPSADGYTFLGWLTQDGACVTDLAYTGGGKETTLSALWVSDVSVAATAKDESDGWFGLSRKYSASAAIEGGTLEGMPDAFAEGVSVTTRYVFHLTGGALNETKDATYAGYHASDSCSFGGKPVGGKKFEITVTLTYVYTYLTADGSQKTVTFDPVSRSVDQGW